MGPLGGGQRGRGGHFDGGGEGEGGQQAREKAPRAKSTLEDAKVVDEEGSQHHVARVQEEQLASEQAPELALPERI